MVYMDNQSCISNEVWLRYAEGKLNADELEVLSSHVITCDMCMDIKSGIDAMKQPKGLADKIKTLEKLVDAHPKIKNKQLSAYVWFGIAATLLAVSGLLLLLLKPQEEELAVHYPKPSQVQSVPEANIPKTDALEPKLKTKPSKQKKPEVSILIPKEKSKEENVPLNNDRPQVASNSPTPVEINEQKAKTLNLSEADAGGSAMEDDFANSREEVTEKPKASVQSLKTKKENVITPYEQAAILYRQGKFDSCIALFRQLKRSEQRNETWLLLAGKSYLSKQDTVKAIDLLNAIPKSNSSAYFEAKRILDVLPKK